MTTITTGRSRPDPKELGRRGELFAIGWLTGRGYEVLQRNWRCALGELDVVAHDGDDLVAIEVKTRSGSGYGTPAEAVDRVKLARLYRLIHAWSRSIAAQRPRPSKRRVDVLSLVWPPGEAAPTRIELYKAVTS
jgi:putative endonuclease